MDPYIAWHQPEHNCEAQRVWDRIWKISGRGHVKEPMNPLAPPPSMPTFHQNGWSDSESDKSGGGEFVSLESDGEPFAKADNLANTFNFNIRGPKITHLYGGMPWRHSTGGAYAPSLVGLSEEIEDFYCEIKPQDSEFIIRNEVFQKVQNIIRDLWPQAIVDSYGSFKTGLFLPTSDIDIVVVGKWDVLPLWTLERAFRESGTAAPNSIKVLDKAAVPIIKLTDSETKIKVDISFNVINGVKSAKMILDYINEFPALPKLAFVLKQFLLQRDLNEVFTGGLSSYATLLMIVSFLQQHPSRDTRTDSVNLGILLIEFFELYGRHFNYLTTAIQVTERGRYVPKSEIQKNMSDGHRPSILCIEDPLQPGNCLGKNSYGAMKVKQAFEYAFLILSKAVNRPESVLRSQNQSVLGRIIRITDDVINYRMWLRQKFSHTMKGSLMLKSQAQPGSGSLSINGCASTIAACKSIDSPLSVQSWPQDAPPVKTDQAVLGRKKKFSSAEIVVDGDQTETISSSCSTEPPSTSDVASDSDVETSRLRPGDPLRMRESERDTSARQQKGKVSILHRKEKLEKRTKVDAKSFDLTKDFPALSDGSKVVVKSQKASSLAADHSSEDISVVAEAGGTVRKHKTAKKSPAKRHRTR